MKRKIFKSIAYALLLCVVAVLFIIFYPRNYNVPIEEGKNIQYWSLTDGSKIAYTLIPARGEKKVYPIIYLHGGPGGFISDIVKRNN